MSNFVADRIRIACLRYAAACLVICLAGLLSACSLSPGMYMGPPQAVAKSLEDAGAPPGALMTITPELISQQKAALATATQQDVEGLFGIGKAYKIGSGDILNITVWGHPELTTVSANVEAAADPSTRPPTIGDGYNVSHDGLIQFPFIGAIKVAGLTEYEARSLLTRRLAPYITDPQLTVRIKAYRNGRVYIDGEVRTPGLQTMDDIPLTLPEAINRAGGFTPAADRSSIILTRHGATTRINLPQLISTGINPTRILLESGDLLRVVSREESKVFVLGDVVEPRSQPLHDGRLTLSDALGEAKGVNPAAADPRQIYVIRGGAGSRPEIYHLDASSPTAFVLANGFFLQARDIVFVDPAPVVRWNRVISMLLPSYGVVYSTREITR